MLAVLAPPGDSWFAEHDRLLLHLLYNTGARISEMIAVKVEDVVFSESASVHLFGKGRKYRTVPLWPTTAKLIRHWLKRNLGTSASSPLLPNRGGTIMTRVNAAQRLERAIKHASIEHPELLKMQISPHTIRHTTAMHLLQSGVDISVIALWLGHESPSTTHMYIEADLNMKEQALARVQPPDVLAARYLPSEPLIAFLRAL
jgi:integrase/recombinase XerD